MRGKKERKLKKIIFVAFDKLSLFRLYMKVLLGKVRKIRGRETNNLTLDINCVITFLVDD